MTIVGMALGAPWTSCASTPNQDETKSEGIVSEWKRCRHCVFFVVNDIETPRLLVFDMEREFSNAAEVDSEGVTLRSGTINANVLRAGLSETVAGTNGVLAGTHEAIRTHHPARCAVHSDDRVAVYFTAGSTGGRACWTLAALALEAFGEEVNPYILQWGGLDEPGG